MLDNQAKPYLIAAELYAYAEQTSLIITPTGDMYEIARPPDEIRAILQQCNGSRTVAEIAIGSPATSDILTMLAESACITFERPARSAAAWQRFAGSADGLKSERVAQTRLVVVGHKQLVVPFMVMAALQAFASVSIVEIADVAAAVSTSISADVVLLALYVYEDAAALAQIDELCDELGVRWLALRFVQGAAWLGPAVIPGHTAHYRDLLARRAAAAESAAMHVALLAPPLSLSQGAPCAIALPPPAELAWVAGLLLTELQRWLVGAPCRLISSELCVEPLSLRQTAYPLLPAPNRVLAHALQISATKDPRILHNQRSGIITDLLKLQLHRSIPPVFKIVQARLAQNPDWLNDPLSMTSLYDIHAVPADQQTTESGFQSAQAIGIEQAPAQVLLDAAKYYCDSNFYAAQARLADYQQLTRASEHALDPQQLALFAESMYMTPRCPFVPFRHDTPAYWVQGRSLMRDVPAWIPANLVYVNWQLADFVREQTPQTQSSSYTGLAAGWTLEQALVSAIEDCIRRDTMMLWWFNQQLLPAIQPTAELAALWAGTPSELGQQARLIYLPNQFGLPVIAGVLENSAEKLLTIGFGYGDDPIAAALQAWAEAATSQEASRDMNDPQGLTRQSVEQGLLNDAFKPWRADRAYLDDFRADFRDMTDPLVQRQLYLDPRAIERVRPLIDPPATLTFADIPAMPERSLEFYRERLAAHGFEIFWLDLTPPDIEVVGLKVVRVVIPGLLPNFPAAFPAVGSARVRQVPVELGWRATPLAEDALNYMPLPGA